ncbi:MAG: bifunctional 4-hydroxy-2-oxoglutarate aldolase/2-dehydro-3-deoxy-phosphogluconate aldolase [Verrucomicrobia bacterium]|nr:bifunctional 4-hydroxy-2-oxoglutarate aldolase/2-dehydro-3-deoxy-phosphogluconate aldolase [Cytophagales bacterium]
MARFTQQEIYDKLTTCPIVPVFYSPDVSHTFAVLEACYKGGLRAFEFTNRGGEAYAVFTEIRKYTTANCPEMALGIGTIYTAAEAEKFIEAGTDFVVQPITTAEVGKICQKYDLPWLPGAMTLTEIYQAMVMGAEMVKVFPGNVLGPDFIKAIKGPMPKAKLMVTGGIEPTKENLEAWFKAGVVCVGMGSQLFGKNVDTSTLAEKIKSLIQIVKAITDDK